MMTRSIHETLLEENAVLKAKLAAAETRAKQAEDELEGALRFARETRALYQQEQMRAEKAEHQRDEAEKRARRLHEVVEKLQWCILIDGSTWCPACDAMEIDGAHHPGCEIHAALAQQAPQPTQEWNEYHKAIDELCARLRDEYENSGHPVCPDPECGVDMDRPDSHHEPDCAYLRFVSAQDALIARKKQAQPEER